jgi:quercetin dioxygenase-like cupin family protein
LAPVTSDLELGRFLQSLGRALGESAGAQDVDAGAGIDRLAQLARSIVPTPSVPHDGTSAKSLPVCRFWDAAIASAIRGGSPLADALIAIAPSLSWTQNPNYRRKPPDAAFLDHYGYAVIVGPSDGPPALAHDPSVAIGVLLLGPRTHYPLHSHPAVEAYYTLSEDGEWWRDPGPWRREPPGSAIYHTPNIPHATRTGAGPLLAIYLWTGDLATHASLYRNDAASRG